MENDFLIDEKIKPWYFGRILNGTFGHLLKDRVSECILISISFEKTGNPAIPYLAAWERNKKSIWYEFAAKRFVEMMGCGYTDLAEMVRTRILDRHVYKYSENEGIIKEVMGRDRLDGAREELREDTRFFGSMEAVYKISPVKGEPFWVKDQAIIETYPADNICLSLGSLTVVSKEMEAEEERERLVSSLREALANVKTLQGLLPICASCKKIRDDKGYWNQIETYFQDHTDLVFSHSVCPDCCRKLYPELKKKPSS
ncbi:MAG: hypothetical protein AB1659_05790 [Thermodesulfobacteriota bacterium]